MDRMVEVLRGKVEEFGATDEIINAMAGFMSNAASVKTQSAMMSFFITAGKSH